MEGFFLPFQLATSPSTAVKEAKTGLPADYEALEVTEPHEYDLENDVAETLNVAAENP